MRKLINKKGFSLVELMIVVVIMGILIAVAIPLYNAVTGNAEAKTCGSNQRMIRGTFANWVIMNNNENNSTTLFQDGN
ncbi:MAG: prepilin-type N-terminal cleavage/methylation domain-containing protein, partial [Clostridia bacterium]|nr:prepilin-type N-terminal cleavage/methylation domain-containing protein [Clostridia bacterium]